MRARYVVVADGANSRFGRALGTARDRTLSRSGMAIRGYFTSPRHDEPWIESHLDIRDRDGNHLPGYGWIFPVGDGTVNVGVGLLSTFTELEVDQHLPADGGVLRDRARLVGASRPRPPPCAPTGGRLPTGSSVEPRGRPDVRRRRRRRRDRSTRSTARASRSPTRPAAWLPTRSTSRSTTGDGLALRTYDTRLDEVYGLYFKVARAFVRAIGNPAVMRELTRVGMHSRTLMEWVLRIMANLLRPDEIGPAEAAYRAVAALVRIAPEP